MPKKCIVCYRVQPSVNHTLPAAFGSSLTRLVLCPEHVEGPITKYLSPRELSIRAEDPDTRVEFHYTKGQHLVSLTPVKPRPSSVSP